MLKFFLIFSGLSMISAITVSGISSGGFFAVQFQVAYSSSVTGTAVLAGGPYYCSQNSVTTALSACMTGPSKINTTVLVQATQGFANLGLIDNTQNLKTSKIWLFSGSLDTVVLQGVVKKTQEYFGSFVNTQNFQTHWDVPAEHSWTTNVFGNVCAYLGSPFINFCDFDAAGKFLSFFYGSLKSRGDYDFTHLHIFDQSRYGDVVLAGMLGFGYVYVPTPCLKQTCAIHVAFHGCLQSAELLGTTFVSENGLNSWAETNQIIIIYPQTISSPSNPQGCWDFWGYTGNNFAYKTGRQMQIVYAMTQNVPYIS